MGERLQAAIVLDKVFVIVDPGDYTRAFVYGAYLTREEAEAELEQFRADESLSDYVEIQELFI